MKSNGSTVVPIPSPTFPVLPIYQLKKVVEHDFAATPKVITEPQVP
jgi:hypothetical protein